MFYCAEVIDPVRTDSKLTNKEVKPNVMLNWNKDVAVVVGRNHCEQLNLIIEFYIRG